MFFCFYLNVTVSLSSGEIGTRKQVTCLVKSC